MENAKRNGTPKALFLSYFFPPTGEGGVQRTVKFLKYLSRERWDLGVICGRPHGMPTDHSLSGEVPDSVAVMEVGSGAEASVAWPLRALGALLAKVGVPDEVAGWVLPATFAAREELLKTKAKYLYTTASPFSSHLVGLLLKRQFGANIRWTADFRDPWTMNIVRNKNRNWLQKRIDRFFEAAVVKWADCVVHTTRTNARNAAGAFAVSGEKVISITNGYDEDDFCDILPSSLLNNGQFNVVYTGNFYGDYNPGNIILALKDIIRESDDIRMVFIGNSSSWVQLFIEREGLEYLLPKIQLEGYVAHRESVAAVCGANMLLLLLPKYMDYCLPGKVFEYLRSGRFVLAVMNKKGECADLVRRAGTGVVADIDDMEEIRSAFLGAYERWKQGALTSACNQEVLGEFDRAKLAARLEVALLGELEGLAEGPPPADARSDCNEEVGGASRGIANGGQ